jgi:hypothetical protein
MHTHTPQIDARTSNVAHATEARVAEAYPGYLIDMLE